MLRLIQPGMLLCSYCVHSQRTYAADTRFKTILLFAMVLVLAITGSAFAVLHRTDFNTKVHFSLLGHTGACVTEADMRGQHLLACFGFTSCVNTCPIQMAKLVQIVQQLDQDKIEKSIAPIFIAVDPGRDSVERLAEYLGHFDSRFIGLTGAPAALARATNSFSAFFTKKYLSRTKLRCGSLQCGLYS